jgi:hemolysin III
VSRLRAPTSEVDFSYDARRDLVYRKPVWRGWMHLVCFEASLVVGTVMIIGAHGALRTTAAAMYAASVSGLFGASALYHRGSWSPPLMRALQRLDHAMIFFLIAGTATPVFLIVVPRPVGIVMLAVMWTLTAGGMVTHLAWMTAPEVLVGATFIGLGCLAGLALPFVWHRVGVAAFVLMLAGGVLYIAGAVLYHRRWPDPSPSVFGFHEVFHAFVSAAAAAQYVAIAVFIV